MSAKARVLHALPDLPSNAVGRHLRVADSTVEALLEAQEARLIELETTWDDVHPVVQLLALAATGGDMRRIRVLSPTAVRILNRPERKRA